MRTLFVLVVGLGVCAASVATLLRVTTPRLVVAQSPPSCTFTDHPLVAGVTPIKAVHITELRTCVNNIRTWLSLSAVTWAEAITANVTTIQAPHVIEFAVPLNQAYTAAGLSPPQWGPAPTGGITLVTVSEINQIRVAINNLLSALTCSATASPLSISVSAAENLGVVNVSAAPSCAWSATSLVSWIVVTGGASGQGNGQVTYQIEPNTETAAPRSSTLAIGGQTVSITQAGGACEYFVSPTTLNVPAGGGTVTVGISTPNGCSWTATEDADFTSIASGGTGSGNGTTSITVAAHSGSSSRVAAATIAGHAIAVIQAGTTPDCINDVLIDYMAFGSDGGFQDVSVSAPAGCATALTASLPPWVTVVPSSGVGTWTTRISVAQNSGLWRTGVVAYGRISVAVEQAGPSSDAFFVPYSLSVMGTAPSHPPGCTLVCSRIIESGQDNGCEFRCYGGGGGGGGVPPRNDPPPNNRARGEQPEVPPRLKLFLDVDQNFDATHTSDHPGYVPGSNLSGVSVTLPQVVWLIAAYVTRDDTIVPPPSTSNANFALSETSRFLGSAMNRGTETTDDYELVASTANWQPGPDHTARVQLRALDYGGFTRVTVTHNGRAADFRLPLDDLDNNTLPDGGWLTTSGMVPGSGAAGDDSESDTGGEPGPPLMSGDGIVKFEEYRGFMVGGSHIRLNPIKADLFIQDLLGYGEGDAVNLPVTIHFVNESELGLTGEANFNYTNGTETIPSHYDQKAVKLRNGGFHQSAFGQVLDRQLGGTAVYGLPPKEYGDTLIYLDTIRLFSPPTNNTTVSGEPFDDPKIMQTLGHEIGHNLGLYEAPFSGSCPPGAVTVMVTNYFTSPPTTNVNDCKWNHIPHSYTPTEKVSIRLR